MSTVGTRNAPGKTTRPKHKKEPGTIRIQSHRARMRLTEPPRALVSDAHRHHANRKVTRKTPKWARRSTKAWVLEVLTYVLTIALALWVLRAIGIVITGKSWSFPFDADKRCDTAKIGVSCGALSGLVMTVFSLALASAVFLFWRLRHVRGPYVKRAKDKEKSRALVQTAGKILDDVVGRSKLCHVIMDDLRDPDARPHLIVGGVGSGKTAVLLKLTRTLAENRAVPVPIRLRDACNDLNFEALARARFIDETTRLQMSDAEGGKVWRRLIAEKQIVVLADGLEEALIGNPERDSLIRLAIDEAHRDRLPLVIASRPHEAITCLDVATIDLEPLSEEAAIDYICDVSPTSDERRIDWVVETADVTETPLYRCTYRSRASYTSTACLNEPSCVDRRITWIPGASTVRNLGSG